MQIEATVIIKNMSILISLVMHWVYFFINQIDFYDSKLCSIVNRKAKCAFDFKLVFLVRLTTFINEIMCSPY